MTAKGGRVERQGDGWTAETSDEKNTDERRGSGEREEVGGAWEGTEGKDSGEVVR